MQAEFEELYGIDASHLSVFAVPPPRHRTSAVQEPDQSRPVSIVETEINYDEDVRRPAPPTWPARWHSMSQNSIELRPVSVVQRWPHLTSPLARELTSGPDGDNFPRLRPQSNSMAEARLTGRPMSLQERHDMYMFSNDLGSWHLEELERRHTRIRQDGRLD